MHDNSEFDYIIVGAGAAGNIIASRLSEDENSRVLLVEAGNSDKSLFINMPGALPFVYQNQKIGWGIQSGPEPHLNMKFVDEKAGKVLGGSTSINAMIFNRGNPLDYDGWANTGLTDWSYANVLPYFRKMETFVDGESDWRGSTGPMKINRCAAEHKLYDTFLRGGEQAGFEVTPDHNGFKQEGLHIAQSFINNGIRWSSTRGYLDEARTRQNLKVLLGAQVNKVVIEAGRAIGVEVLGDKQSITLRACKEVIVCAGAMNSPKLLMLSGIGDPQELARHQIELVAAVPEVGKNLQNHPGVDIQYTTNYEDSLTSELNLVGRAKLGAQWLFLKRGLGTTNFFEAGAFLKTRDDVEFPNMQYEFLPLTRQLKNGKLVPIPGFQFFFDLSRPESRGYVSLRSANPHEQPNVVFNHMAIWQDLKDMIDGVRLAREMIHQPAWDKYRGVELTPGPDVQSDSDLENFIRHRTTTAYHPSGSCRMGADENSVVDSNGCVRGVFALRVVDASIMPLVITGNLNAAVMMMAEKISDHIRGIEPLSPSTASFYRS